jgi:RNA polymerase sigma factor (sigma-70 family)
MIALVEPLIPALRRYARSLLRDATAADDLVQDCLERTVSRWHERRSGGDAKSWVFTILHNLAINHIRQRARRGPHLVLDDAGEAALAVPPAQEDGLRHRELMRALDDLPDDQRSVLLLISVEDLSYAETARVLGIPVGTVMSRLSRAREKLHRTTENESAGARQKRPELRRVK